MAYTHQFYQGGLSTLDPDKSKYFTGYRADAGTIAATTSPQTANIIQEVHEKLRTGAKTVELSLIQPQIFEAIPKQMFGETKKLAELTGAELTVHGPLLEPSGFSRQGGGYSESNREGVQRQMEYVIDRSHDLDIKGNIPVTFHSSVELPGTEVQKTKDGEEIVTSVLVINKENNNLGKIPIKEKRFADEGKIDVRATLDEINQRSWIDSLTNVDINMDRAIERISNSQIVDILRRVREGEGKPITEDEKRAEFDYNIGKDFLRHAYDQMRTMFETAYEHGTETDRMSLEKFNARIKDRVLEIGKDPQSEKSVKLTKEIIEEGTKVLRTTIPELYQPLEKFAMDKSAESFAGAAVHGFKKYGMQTPIVSIENPPVGGAFSRSEELKNLITKSREKFVEQVTGEVINGKKISKKEAEAAAERVIGATWDVGHINMLKKYGFSDKDIIAESKRISPYVKHVHLSDNFGLEHTELPMGMGNVPFKEIMKELGEKGKKAKKVGETGSWFSALQQQQYPFQENLEALGSPIYQMKMDPYWNQSPGFYQGYYGGFGRILPPTYFSTWGSGFSQLPAELGGEQHQQGSRLAGRPLE